MADVSDKRSGRSSGRRSERQGSRKATANRPTAGTRPSRDQGWPRWGIWLVLGLIASVLFFPNLFPADDLDRATDALVDMVADLALLPDGIDDDRDGRADCDDTDCSEAANCQEPAGPTFVRGDANSDGSINLTDGVIPLLFLFSGGGAPVCLDAADANDSGAIEITDAIIIFSWLFTGGDVPAEPSPTAPGYSAADCGEDLTEDGIDCEQASAVCQ